ncbi:MAG: hypothetical protein PVH84_11695 [Candidatus Aminicenantes bacterium]
MRWKNKKLCLFLFLMFCVAALSAGDTRENVYKLGTDLERTATQLAKSNYDHFRGWNAEFTDEEQAVLFKSEAFLASCRLFLRLAEERSEYLKSGYVRTNLYHAFVYLNRAFKDLLVEMRNAGVMPYSLNQCERILERMDTEFSGWPSVDNLSYLHEKYVKAGDASVYKIERQEPGVYILRAFKNLESLYRYNYSLNRGNNPWDHLVEVPYETLERMEEGPVLDLSFEGELIIELSTRPNRPVYLIENGKKRGVTSPRILERLGGWDRVYEVPAEIINSYPDGEPIKQP